MMNFLKGNAVAVLTIASIAAHCTFAASTATATSVASTATSATSKRKPFPINISASSFLYGPQVNDVGSDLTSDAAIDAKTPIGIENLITFKYKFNDEESVGLVPDIYYQPTDAARDNTDGFHMLDSYAFYKKKVVSTKIDGHSFDLTFNPRLNLPASKSSWRAKTIAMPELRLIPSMQFEHSPISIDVFAYARYYIQAKKFNPDSGAANRMFKFYAGPQVSYAFNDTTSAFVLYEMIMIYNTEGQPLTNYSPNASTTDLEPGVSFQITKSINLSPYLNWYLNQPIKTTSLNLNAAFEIL